MTTLTNVIAAAILIWSPPREHNQPQLQGSLAESPEAYEARVASIAGDIVEVVSAPEEQPLFGDADLYKTSIALATLSFFEGREMLYVDRGKCQDPTWTQTEEGHRQMMSGDCDGGLGPGHRGYAYSLWQIHPEEGVVLTANGGWSRAFNFSPQWRATHSGEIIGGREMLEDRKVAIRVALHMARQSLKAGAGLCNFTGGDDITRGCPKAKARLNFARAWWTAHPYVSE